MFAGPGKEVEWAMDLGDRSFPKVSTQFGFFSADLTETGSEPGFPPKDLMIITGFWGKNIPHEFP